MFYKKRIEKADTPAQVAERIAYNAACRKATADTKVRFPQITAENMDAALEYKQQRINEILAGGEEAWNVYLQRHSGRGRHYHDVVLAASKAEAIKKAEQANPGYRAVSANNSN